MLNVTFAGNIFNSVENQYVNNEVLYQILFHSDTISKWSSVRTSELGQYNFNLGDDDLLSPIGNISTGDKIIICFWTDNTKLRNSLTLIEWSFIELEYDGKNIYINNTQTKPFQNPVCNFTTFGNVIVDNVATTNDQIWLFDNVEHFQEYQRYDQVIFEIMSFQPDCITIDWGDSQILTYDIESEYYHEYDLAGDYHITITATNRGNLSCTSEHDVQATFIINPGLIWSIPSWVNIQATFEPRITGDVDQISGVTYAINDIDTYFDFDYDTTFYHTFTKPGPHKITQKITYDNIFETTTISQDYIIYLDTVANFYKDIGTCGPIFIDNSIVGNGKIEEYYWSVIFQEEIIAEYTSLFNSSWEYNWPYPGIFKIQHKVKDSEGNQFGIERVYEVDECSGGKKEVIGGGGGWVEQVFVEKEFPKLKITKLEELDERIINIGIKMKLLEE